MEAQAGVAQAPRTLSRPTLSYPQLEALQQLVRQPGFPMRKYAFDNGLSTPEFLALHFAYHLITLQHFENGIFPIINQNGRDVVKYAEQTGRLD